MDTLTKNGITPIPSENCLHELKYIEDQDLNKFLCIGLLLNQKPVYLLNIDSTKLTDEKVKNILTKFNSHKSSICNIRISSADLHYFYPNIIHPGLNIKRIPIININMPPIKLA